MEGPEKEWWEGTELGLLREYQFPGHVTASDVSVGTGSMGSGFVWLDRSKCGSERVGREEEGTSSGRAEMGAYAAILRHTPDHEDLLTVTESEVLCRLVVRWVGQDGKDRGEPLNEGEDDTWSRTIRNTSRRGVVESLLEERLQLGENKWRKGMFEGHGEGM